MRFPCDTATFNLEFIASMQLGEFIDVFCQRPQNFAWFLGAGASRSSGLPTASDIIWYMKRRYYCREENQDIDRQNLLLGAVKSKIQSYMDSKGFPAEGASQEYTMYFDKIFGDNREHQRKFLASILKEEDVKLSVGNRVFGALLFCGYCRVAFSTNFDTVVEMAYAQVSGKSLASFHLEGSAAANAALNNEDYPVYCKIHGDFRYESIKNLSADLAGQNRELSDCLINSSNRLGIVVSGYSGRDTSVMDLFNKILDTANPFPHGVYWTGLRGAAVPPGVLDFLDRAKEKCVAAEYVEVDTFDALMLRLWRNIPNKPEEMDKRVRRSEIVSTSIDLPRPGSGDPLVRMNALPVTQSPTKCLKLTFRNPKEWRDLKVAQRASKENLIFTKEGAVWCWGTKSALREVFHEEIQSIEPDDVSQRFAAFSKNLQFQAFFQEGLCNALAKGKPLLTRTDRHSSYLIVDDRSEDLSQLRTLKNVVGQLHGIVPGILAPKSDEHPNESQVKWVEAVRVSIDQKDGQIWVLLDPEIWIWPKRARSLAPQFLSSRKRDRQNKKYNDLLSGWIEAALGTSGRNVEVTVSSFREGSEAENPSFTIGSRTAFSKGLV